MKIKDLAEDDRPREKMIAKGADALSDAELLAILLGTGTRELSAVDLARTILKLAENNLQELGRKSLSDLQSVKGIGCAKAVSLAAALELGRRRKLSEALERKNIGGSQDAVALLQPLLADLGHEEFWAVFLNQANKVLSCERISQGGIAGTVADMRIIFKQAVVLSASALILAHNHPSGNELPSRADEELTKKAQAAGNALDVRVLDHIIIAGTRSYSFMDNGKL